MKSENKYNLSLFYGAISAALAVTVATGSAQAQNVWATCDAAMDTSDVNTVHAMQSMNFANDRCDAASNVGFSYTAVTHPPYFFILMTSMPSSSGEEVDGFHFFWGSEFSNIRLGDLDLSGTSTRYASVPVSMDEDQSLEVVVERGGQTYSALLSVEGGSNTLAPTVIYEGDIFAEPPAPPPPVEDVIWANCGSSADTSSNLTYIAHQVFDFNENQCFSASNFNEDTTRTPLSHDFRMLMNSTPNEGEDEGFVIYWGTEFSNIIINGDDVSDSANRMVRINTSTDDFRSFVIQFDRGGSTYQTTLSTEGGSNTLRPTSLFERDIFN